MNNSATCVDQAKGTSKNDSNNDVQMSETSKSVFFPSLPLGLSVFLRPAWIPDEHSPNCMLCMSQFTFWNRRHHCRKCGVLVCNSCSNFKLELSIYGYSNPERVCNNCFSKMKAMENTAAKIHEKPELDDNRSSISDSIFSEEDMAETVLDKPKQENSGVSECDSLEKPTISPNLVEENQFEAAEEVKEKSLDHIEDIKQSGYDELPLSDTVRMIVDDQQSLSIPSLDAVPTKSILKKQLTMKERRKKRAGTVKIAKKTVQWAEEPVRYSTLKKGELEAMLEHMRIEAQKKIEQADEMDVGEEFDPDDEEILDLDEIDDVVISHEPQESEISNSVESEIPEWSKSQSKDSQYLREMVQSISRASPINQHQASIRARRETQRKKLSEINKMFAENIVQNIDPIEKDDIEMSEDDLTVDEEI